MDRRFIIHHIEADELPICFWTRCSCRCISRSIAARLSRDQKNWHLAVFGNLTYTINDWEMGIGARIDRWEEEDITLMLRQTELFIPQNRCYRVSPRISVSRHVERLYFYFTASQGYELGA